MASSKKARLARSKDAWIAGVAAGIAESLGVDPTIVRLVFAVATFFGGSGLLVYLICWAIMPRATGGSVGQDLIVKARNWYDSQ